MRLFLNEKKEALEYYFDICKNNRLDTLSKVPCYDDLYLDITYLDGKINILDEHELIEAYKYGAAPHGGMGIGLDRLAMIICGADNLRDVTAFPKVQNASELMSQAPGKVDEKQLEELGIQIVKKED